MSETYGRFYSRQMGWPDGTPVKSFYSEKIYLPKDFDINLINGKKMRQILQLDLPIFHNLSASIKKIYIDWYFYLGDIEITSNISL